MVRADERRFDPRRWVNTHTTNPAGTDTALIVTKTCVIPVQRLPLRSVAIINKVIEVGVGVGAKHIEEDLLPLTEPPHRQ